MRRKRRSFTDEFKAEAVAMVRQRGLSVGQVAKDLDLTETALREWVKKAEDADKRVASVVDGRLKPRLFGPAGPI